MQPLPVQALPEQLPAGHDGLSTLHGLSGTLVQHGTAGPASFAAPASLNGVTVASSEAATKPTLKRKALDANTISTSSSDIRSFFKYAPK